MDLNSSRVNADVVAEDLTRNSPDKQLMTEGDDPHVVLKTTPDKDVTVPNERLLRSALIAHAKDMNSIHEAARNLKVVMKMNDPNASLLKRTLGLDMKEVPNNGHGDLGYGISHDLQGGNINFLGTPENGVGGKKITIVISNGIHGHILKQLSVEGVSNSPS